MVLTCNVFSVVGYEALGKINSCKYAFSNLVVDGAREDVLWSCGKEPEPPDGKTNLYSSALPP